jgi:hypothetical protein
VTENLKGSLLEKPWNQHDARDAVSGPWKGLDAWVYGYRAVHQERYIWQLMENNPLNSQAVQKLASDGWKVLLTDMEPGSGRCSDKEKIMRISANAVGYQRDESLFHEMVHAHYGKALDDNRFTNRFSYEEDLAIIEWLARIYRSDYRLLKTSIGVFNLTPQIYDKPSYLAFAENPIDFKKQYILPWGIKTKIRFSSILMHCV